MRAPRALGPELAQLQQLQQGLEQQHGLGPPLDSDQGPPRPRRAAEGERWVVQLDAEYPGRLEPAWRSASSWQVPWVAGAFPCTS